ncbi:peptidase S1 [Lysobacter arseniciresistens ZS79]|uniref:Probable periplasmic serine endoprotease DegP-like n=1 Tax=Lysobacter arseniciresistens ZS79 TaxID=913325 RepID=A0A0A0F2Z7_9GAMM|nr:DegQ family serine endoprotease [Lysobacter arseniciresistens]KGM57521.1 peptidase S1 [Lysobacter arseniciresistens ZS79]
MNRPIRSIALLGVLAAAMPVACTAQQSPTVAAAASSQAVTPPTAAPIVTGLPDFTRLVERVGPAVVNISARIAPPERDPRSQMPPGFEDFLRRFGMPMPGVPDGPRGGGTSLGSGFIISDDGYVLTNHHVINGADEVTVTLSDRREFKAEVVGSDEQYDVALLKIDADDLRWLRAGQSSGLQPGQWVVAIGSPFGLDHSVTAGIVSAVGRSNPYAGQQYVPFIQTDVAINRGNSGGPLLNTSGEVVGINSQIFSNSGGYMGVSFAIPIDLAMNAVEQIKETGEVRRGMLGVNIQAISPEMVKAMGLPDSRGAIVSNVQPGSAAEKAGIRRMDVIRAFNGTRINDASDLPPIVGAVAPGSKATVEVLRDGDTRRLDLVVGAESARGGIARAATDDGRGASEAPSGANALGMTARELDAGTRQRLGVAGQEGVLLAAVDPEITRESGVRPGDVVLQVGRDTVSSPAAFNRALSGVKPGDTVMLLVSREGSSQFVAVTAPAD